MNSDTICSRCRHWDVVHVQRTELDEDSVPELEYNARCMNPGSPCKGRHMEADQGCDHFEPR